MHQNPTFFKWGNFVSLSTHSDERKKFPSVLALTFFLSNMSKHCTEYYGWLQQYLNNLNGVGTTIFGKSDKSSEKLRTAFGLPTPPPGPLFGKLCCTLFDHNLWDVICFLKSMTNSFAFIFVKCTYPTYAFSKRVY